MKATAVCNGAATIITGFATGKGGAYGIGLENKTSVKLDDSQKVRSIVNGEENVGLVLAESAVRRTCDRYGVEFSGAVVETESDIPHAAGLKSSSVAANAIVLATVGAIAGKSGKITEKRFNKYESVQEIMINNEAVDDMDVLNIGIDAAFDARVTKTGALDDASAAYFGGYTLTHNLERKIEYRGGMEDLDVVIFLPDEKIYSGSVNAEDVKPFSKEVDLLWERARHGAVYSAITLNGLIHSNAFSQDVRPAIEALRAGAIACGLSGTGPSVVALVRDEKDDVVSAFDRFEGDAIVTKTNNQKARVLK